VQGNFIGTNAAGSAGLGNTTAGIDVQLSSNTAIGGTAAGAGNLFSLADFPPIKIPTPLLRAFPTLVSYCCLSATSLD